MDNANRPHDECVHADFKDLLKSERVVGYDDMGKPVTPELYAFDGQDKDEVNKLLKKDRVDYDGMRKPISPGLYAFEGQTKDEVADLLKCEKERQEKIRKEHEDRHGVSAKKQAKMNPVSKPELYAFKTQSKDEAMDLLKKVQKPSTAEFIRDYCNIEKQYPTPKEPKLTFDNASTSFIPDLGAHRNEMSDEHIAPCGLAAEWRKLSGVRPEEKILKGDTLENLMQKILMTAQKRFPQLTLEWADECYNSCLTINGAKTSVLTEPLIEALEGLKEITDELDAERIVTNVIVKKLAQLFI